MLGSVFCRPNLHCCWKLFSESCRRCFQLLWPNAGADTCAPLTVTLTFFECVIVPLVPVTVTMQVPSSEPITVRVLDPDIVTLVGLREAVSPVDGLTVA